LIVELKEDQQKCLRIGNMRRLSTYLLTNVAQRLWMVFVAFTLVFQLQAQTPTVNASQLPQELSFLHVAKTGYVAGETIWFKVYVTYAMDGKLSGISKIAYVELIGQDGIPVLQEKTGIENGVGNGAWTIPGTLATGTYQMRCYVAEQKQWPATFFTAPIQIINPTKPPTYSQAGGVNASPIEQRGLKNIQESNAIAGVKTEYKTRELVDISFGGYAVGANLSVSVFRIDSLETKQGLSPVVYPQLPPSLKINSKEIVPVEYAGHLVSGKVLDKFSGKPLSGIAVYLGVKGERFYFGNAKSDIQGNVRFAIGKPYGAQQLVVQLPNHKDSNALVQLENPFFEKPISYTNAPGFLNSSNKKWIEERILEYNLQKAFETNTSATYFYPNYNDSAVFFGKPDKTYYLDDYTRFNTMEEVLREYVVEVELKKQQQNYKFSVLDIPHKKSFENNPLVLVDGVATNDINKVVAFDPLKVKKLDVVSRKFFQGDLAFDGIVSFTTYNGDLAGFVLDDQTLLVDYPLLQLQRQFEHPRYTDDNARKNRLPDLRNLLYWNPDIQPNTVKKEGIQFYTSDLPGNFAVLIKGVDQDGNPIHVCRYFSVVK